MKNRDYKQFERGTISHLYNRGNNKMDIFKDQQDYMNFLARLCLVLNIPKMPFGMPMRSKNRTLSIIPLPANSLDLICFVLMPNHFHFLLQQNSNISPAKFIHKLCTSYSKYFSSKYEHVGNVFQDQYKAVNIIGNGQFLWIKEYIHNNPVRAGLCNLPQEYKWSSFTEYLSNLEGICNKKIYME
jgi:putative transposase